ncbi:MAG: radical SAM protein, partial [Oscillospiraceae bacterium]|nr:radical SAM protein [Oscillospiraceae bacterium]
MPYNTISHLDEDCPLRGIVEPGDELLSINGHEIRDVLDYKYWSYETELTLEFRTAGLVRVDKDEGEDLGLNFEDYLMDKPTGCANRCIFCFVDQLPGGLRSTLYFKDDDARLSFLTGNYITATNLSPRELQRICELRVSPLNISVHATNGELRARMLQNKRGAEIMDILRRFAAAGIYMDCQIVLCPGWNDGAELQRSMEDLASLYPAVGSVSIVPV